MDWILKIDTAFWTWLWNTLKIALETATIGSALIFTFWKTFGKKWYGLYRASRDQFRTDMLAEMKILKEDVKLVKAQVFPDGGFSMNDDIKDIKKHLTEQDVKLLKLEIGQKASWEILDIPTWESDENGDVIFVSIGLCELLGYTHDDLLGRSWAGLLIDEDRDRIVKKWLDSVATASHFNETYTYKKSDGSLQKVNGIARHNKGRNGKVINSFGRLNRVGEPFKK